MLHAVRRLDVRVNVDALIEIQAPVGSPAERVQDVVCVLGAEAGEYDARLVSLLARLARTEVDQLRTVGDIRSAVARLDTSWDQQAIREDGCLVGPADAL